jgi:hypothetical protein
VERSTEVKALDGQIQKVMKALLLAKIRGWKQREQVELLDRAGFPQGEIALLLGSTSKAISVRLAEIRKGARARRG